MCGISGFVFQKPDKIDRTRFKSILNGLEHRGPDDLGILYYSDNKTYSGRDLTACGDPVVAFLHRRLSIIDLTDAAWQPMSSIDGRFHLVFNGEIYNYRELKDELAAGDDSTYRSHGDTEVLLHGYAKWGPAVLPRLVGMFAFAILDTFEKTLLLARDFAGIKPLYYTNWENGFAFGSEINVLLDLPGVSRNADPQRAYDYLRFGLTDHGDRTMFADVKQVPSGHYLILDINKPCEPRVQSFWKLDRKIRTFLYAQAAGELRERFLESIRLHMRSDVPVGAALSGGIDSSSIVSSMRLLYPDVEIHSFSFISCESYLSEEKWVDLIGRHANILVHKISPSAQDLVRDLDELIRIQGEPFGSTSIYAQYCVFREARKNGIKVILDGQGADEILGGYKLLVAARLASLIRKGKIARAIEFLRSLSHSEMAGGWLQQLAYATSMIAPENVQAPFIRLWGRESAPDWLSVRWFDERGITRSMHLWHSGADNVLHELLYRAFRETSLPMLLRYEDRNSMAHSIESRVPFLTPELVEFVLSMPEDYIINRHAVTKSIFRESMKGIVPDPILNRRDKVAFATPERMWLNSLESWVDEVLKADATRRIPALNVDKLKNNWQSVLQKTTGDWRNVWRWINFARWVKIQDVTFA